MSGVLYVYVCVLSDNLFSVIFCPLIGCYEAS